MTEWFNAHQYEIRVSSFLLIFIIMAVWEWLRPSRPLKINKLNRWLNHTGLILISTLLIRYVSPFVLTALAYYSQQHQIGILVLLDLPLWLSIFLSVFIMDGLIYAQHRAMHAVPLLWRLHRVHHSDHDFDVTTAVRFHPIEMLLSFFIKAVIIMSLGTPIIAVIIFEVLLSSLALFNHANINLTPQLEKLMRCLIVTPDIHRIHHSSVKAETNSNYGFNLIIWDHLFASYTAQAKEGDENIVIGLNEFKDHQKVTQLHHLLKQPLK